METKNPNLVYPGDGEHTIENLLVCVNYPGKVENPSKAVETLGGLEELSNVMANKKSKMELRFRPSDIFCHKINGERHNTTGMLVRVRAKKHSRQIQSVVIDGIVDTEYRFGGMADFTYLPVQRCADGSVRSRYTDLVPNEEVVEPTYITERKEEPLFLPPPLFSRTEIPHIDVFRKETGDIERNQENNIIGTNRTNRKIYGSLIPFSLEGGVPQQAKPDAYDSVKLKLVQQDVITRLKELFQLRPIWIKSGLLEACGYSHETVKVVLPVVAYNYTNGPWRTSWVRFGYDPRKDFAARFYQTLDYRVRKYGNIKEHTERKPGRGEKRKFSCPTFDEATIPRYMLTIYQFCDINLTEVKAMLEKIPVPATGKLCDEKRGWLPVGFEEQVRAMMTEIVQRNYRNMSREDASTVNDEEDASTLNEEEEEEEDSDSDMDID